MTLQVSAVAQAAAFFLLTAKPLNRGHAFRLLAESDLPETWRDDFDDAVRLYQEKAGRILKQSNRQSRQDNDSEAEQMTAAQVRRRNKNLDKPDPLFWSCWWKFKGGKWKGELTTFDFSMHFVQFETAATRQTQKAIDESMQIPKGYCGDCQAKLDYKIKPIWAPDDGICMRYRICATCAKYYP